MKIIITGARGRLGSSLMTLLAAQQHDVTGYDLPELDIADFAALRPVILAAKPDIVINSAAWTDVDGCAREPEKAYRMNGLAAQNVAIAAAAAGAAMLQVSSNEVFDGKSSQPYLEFDRCNPVNSYGYSKYVGEQGVMAVNPRHYIVRTAWLFAHGGRNFVQSILGAAKAGKPLRVVIDEIANPTSNDDLAQAIARLITTGRYGIYHLTNAGAVSRYTFARHVLDSAGYAETPIEPIGMKEWQRPSTPPACAALANVAAASIGITLRPWPEAVDEFLQKEGLLA